MCFIFFSHGLFTVRFDVLRKSQKRDYTIGSLIISPVRIGDFQCVACNYSLNGNSACISVINCAFSWVVLNTVVAE